MATFESTGQTVFREGDPAVPDIKAELKGRRPVAHVAVSRGYSARGGTNSRLGRLCARGSEMTKRALRALLRRDARLEGSRYDELDGKLADGPNRLMNPATYGWSTGGSRRPRL